ncbi:hypothetical protein EES37_09675 [Streptomyces sp. ADI91-18]|nr:hypothetical protein EES37_09675 [Streptomyces sp. ADI91-18]
MEHDAAVIHVEGPREVTRASVGASSKLQKFRSAVLDYMSAATELDADHRFALLEEKEAEAHTGYLEFLYAASDALDADLLALGE